MMDRFESIINDYDNRKDFEPVREFLLDSEAQTKSIRKDLIEVIKECRLKGLDSIANKLCSLREKFNFYE